MNASSSKSSDFGYDRCQAQGRFATGSSDSERIATGKKVVERIKKEVAWDTDHLRTNSVYPLGPRQIKALLSYVTALEKEHAAVAAHLEEQSECPLTYEDAYNYLKSWRRDSNELRQAHQKVEEEEE